MEGILETTPLRKILRLITGLVFLVLGVAGLLLPIMPGWVFLIPGLVILGDYFPPIKRLVTWAKRKAGMENGQEADKDKQTPSSPC